MGSLYLGGPTIQEVDGKMMMGLSIYGGAVISRSLYSRFYGIYIYIMGHMLSRTSYAQSYVVCSETFIRL